MVCRYDSDDPRKCERCGAFLWLSEDGAFCGDCGVTMPCTMRVVPLVVGASTGPDGRLRVPARPT